MRDEADFRTEALSFTPDGKAVAYPIRGKRCGQSLGATASMASRGPADHYL